VNGDGSDERRNDPDEDRENSDGESSSFVQPCSFVTPPLYAVCGHSDNHLGDAEALSCRNLSPGRRGRPEEYM